MMATQMGSINGIAYCLRKQFKANTDVCNIDNTII